MGRFQHSPGLGDWRAALAPTVGLRILDIMAEKKTWLDGPSIPGENDYETPGRWPGEKLGLPERGAGALAPVSRRAGAVLIDWLLCYAAAAIVGYFVPLFGGVALLTYVLWIVLGILGGWLFARTPGMALRGMGVARLDAPGERVGFWRAAVRTLLTACRVTSIRTRRRPISAASRPWTPCQAPNRACPRGLCPTRRRTWPA